MPVGRPGRNLALLVSPPSGRFRRPFGAVGGQRRNDQQRPRDDRQGRCTTVQNCGETRSVPACYGRSSALSAHRSLACLVPQVSTVTGTDPHDQPTADTVAAVSDRRADAGSAAAQHCSHRGPPRSARRGITVTVIRALPCQRRRPNRLGQVALRMGTPAAFSCSRIGCCGGASVMMPLTAVNGSTANGEAAPIFSMLAST